MYENQLKNTKNTAISDFSKINHESLQSAIFFISKAGNKDSKIQRFKCIFPQRTYKNIQQIFVSHQNNTTNLSDKEKKIHEYTINPTIQS